MSHICKYGHKHRTKTGVLWCHLTTPWYEKESEIISTPWQPAGTTEEWHDLEREYGTMAVKIDGSVSSEKRQAAVDSFQNDPDVRMFIGNIQAAGVGITLTAASNVVFLELPWNSSLLEQAEDRCHRIGAKNAVNIYYILGADTIDASMAGMIVDKKKIINEIMAENGIDALDELRV